MSNKNHKKATIGDSKTNLPLGATSASRTDCSIIQTPTTKGGQSTTSLNCWTEDAGSPPLGVQGTRQNPSTSELQTPRGVGGIFFSSRSLLIALILVFSAFSFAQSLTFGLYGRLSPDALNPTLEASIPLNDLNLNLRAQLLSLRVGLDSALELGTLGRVTYGLGGSAAFGSFYSSGDVMGSGSAFGLDAFVRGGVGPVAFNGYFWYNTPSTRRSDFWVGDQFAAGLTNTPLGEASGFSGGLEGRYRISREQTLGLAVEYTNRWAGEAIFTVRDSATYSFGLGSREGVYGILGWRGELDENGTLLDATLRAGLRNEIQAALTLPLSDEDVNNLKLRLTLAYPWAAKVGLEVASIRADAIYDGGYALWLRYTFNFGEE